MTDLESVQEQVDRLVNCQTVLVAQLHGLAEAHRQTRELLTLLVRLKVLWDGKTERQLEKLAELATATHASVHEPSPP